MRAASFPAGLFLSLLMVGCGVHQPYPTRLDLEATALMPGENPAEVAILPIQDGTGEARVRELLPEFRNALYRQLIARHYTPLGLAFVDHRLGVLPEGKVPAVETLTGKFGEDALLLATVAAWDESQLRVDRRLRATVELHLLSGRSGQELWGGRAQLEVRSRAHGLAGLDELEANRREGVRLLVERILAELPLRRSTSAPAGRE